MNPKKLYEYKFKKPRKYKLMEETHTHYYDLAVRNGMPPCGDGSVLESVIRDGTIFYIDKLIERYDIKSVSDCPCGLYENWIFKLDLPKRNVKYTGYDINHLAIERNRIKFPDLNFVKFNMCNEILPKTDLIICRDCLFHLPNEFALEALDNFKKSKSTYLLSTSQDWVKENVDLSPDELKVEAGNRPLNLEIEPFNMGEPLEIHDESSIDDRGLRSMLLWKIN